MDEEKVYCSMYSRNAELYHHGILGQKWGIQNGPPYPLGSDVSTGKRLKKQINSYYKENKTRLPFLKSFNQKIAKKRWNEIYNGMYEFIKSNPELYKNVKDAHDSSVADCARKLKADNLSKKYYDSAIKYMIEHNFQEIENIKNDPSELKYVAYEIGIQNKPYSVFYYYCKDKGLDPSTELKKYEKIEEDGIKLGMDVAKNYVSDSNQWAFEAILMDSMDKIIFDDLGRVNIPK